MVSSPPLWSHTGMPLPAQNLQVIATRAGVSRMTVSRILRQQPGASPQLREKVLSIARELGYRPNPLITALMTNLRAKRSRPSTGAGTVLAFIERADQLSDARDEHFSGATRAAEEQGYKLEPFIIGKAGLRAEHLNRILRARNIHGVLIAPLPEGHGSFSLNWTELCVVAIEYTFVHPDFDRVVHDSYSAMRLLLSQCRERGCRRLGLLLTKNGRERTEGLNEAAYWLEQKEDRFFASIPPLILDKWNSTHVSTWMKHHRPEAIVTSNIPFDPLRKFLATSRRSQTTPISLLNINSLDPDISGIAQNNTFMGATAARLLIDKMNRNDRGIPTTAQTVLIPGKWVEGSTFRVSSPRK